MCHARGAAFPTADAEPSAGSGPKANRPQAGRTTTGPAASGTTPSPQPGAAGADVAEPGRTRAEATVTVEVKPSGDVSTPPDEVPAVAPAGTRSSGHVMSTTPASPEAPRAGPPSRSATPASPWQGPRRTVRRRGRAAAGAGLGSHGDRTHGAPPGRRVVRPPCPPRDCRAPDPDP
ncbi:hypothetical protein GCM10010240_28350 [Streptomyces griseoviridis]|nr:hypothetical protein GCM10010240_28350 [Streptomyces griseoviridis]